LGFSSFFSEQLSEHPAGLSPARVIAAHRGGYDVTGADRGVGIFALTPAWQRRPALERPAVGDFVLVDDGGRLASVLRRRTQLLRRAAGTTGEAQVVAANVDRVFVVTSANHDFRPRRLDRYLAAIWDGGAEPVVVLNKIDLCGDPAPYLAAVPPGVEVLLASALDATAGHGLESVRARMLPGQTVAFVGSSGVGKSTLLNALCGEQRQATAAIRANDDRGRHTTTHRELFCLPDGRLLIDTPGMRELSLWLENHGLDAAFDDVTGLAASCRFGDCHHDSEPGCAVRSAINDGHLDAERLESLRKLEREQLHQAMRTDGGLRRQEQRRIKQVHKDARQRDRERGRGRW
jgi:ribosome biogenesis GTPase